MVPAHATSVGKAWLAALAPERVDDLFVNAAIPAVTERTIVEAAALRAEMDAIRVRGYATSHGESEDGVGSVGVAVRDGEGEPRLAMSVAVPLSRFTDESCTEAADALREIGEVLGARLSRLV